MSSSQRQIIGAIFGVLGSLLLCIAIFAGILFAGIMYIGRSLCGSEIIQEVPSPDNRYKVIVYESSCGATTGFSTNVSILQASDTLKNNQGGNILTMDGHPDWSIVDITWNTNTLVTIQYNPEYEVYRRKSGYQHGFHRINIEYHPVIENKTP